MNTDQLLSIIRIRRSVRVYKTGKVSDLQLQKHSGGSALGAFRRQHAALGIRRHSRSQEDETGARDLLQ